MRSEQEKTAAIVRAHDCDSAKLIAILQEIQASENYLSQENMELVADMLHISVSRVYSVATFYENFSLEPKGKHIIKVCDGTACHVRKSGPIYDAVYENLREECAQRGLQVYVGLTHHGDAEKSLHIKMSGCHGFCEMGPLVHIEPLGVMYVRVKPEDCREIVERTLLGGEVIERLTYHRT